MSSCLTSKLLLQTLFDFAVRRSHSTSPKVKKDKMMSSRPSRSSSSSNGMNSSRSCFELTAIVEDQVHVDVEVDAAPKTHYPKSSSSTSLSTSRSFEDFKKARKRNKEQRYQLKKAILRAAADAVEQKKNGGGNSSRMRSSVSDDLLHTKVSRWGTSSSSDSLRHLVQPQQQRNGGFGAADDDTTSYSKNARWSPMSPTSVASSSSSPSKPSTRRQYSPIRNSTSILSRCSEGGAVASELNVTRPYIDDKCPMLGKAIDDLLQYHCQNKHREYPGTHSPQKKSNTANKCDLPPKPPIHCSR